MNFFSRIIFLKENFSSSNWYIEACSCKLKFMSNIWQSFKENDSVHLDPLIEMFRVFLLYLEVWWQCLHGMFQLEFLLLFLLSAKLFFSLSGILLFFPPPNRSQYLSLKNCQLQNEKKIVYPIKVRQNTTAKQKPLTHEYHNSWYFWQVFSQLFHL